MRTVERPCTRRSRRDVQRSPKPDDCHAAAHGRVSYRALKRQFAIDDAFLEDLKYELIAVQQRAVDQDDTVLVWTGEIGAAVAPMPAPATAAAVPPPAIRQAQEPLAYTPAYLQERGNEAYALHLLGEIAAHRDPPDVDAAATHYRQALTLAEAFGMHPLQAHCHLGLGTLYAMVGQRAKARTALTMAIEMYRAMDMTFWLPQAEAALAQVC
jgi:tetratricopeptide (TPR) repeat protein